MATANYQHTIGGKGVAEGLPLRRGSHLYDVEPMIRYPNVLTSGTTKASQFQYSKSHFVRPPHLPVTFTISPYVDNHEAGGNLTREQYMVIKRGQPVMTANKREKVIGAFVNDGGATVEDRTYVDPAELATNGTITGFYKPGVDQLKDDGNVTLANPASDADPLITDNEYSNLTTTGTVADETALGNLSQSDLDTLDEDKSISSDSDADGFKALVLDDGNGDRYVYTYDQSGGTDVAAGSNLSGTWTKDGSASNDKSASTYDYKDVTESDPVEPARFADLSDSEKENFRAVYEGLEDNNDQIATGGKNLYAQVDESLFSTTDLVENVIVDADDYYFQTVSQLQGFMFPSSGGAQRTIFYNEVDQEAGVTLPTKGSGQDPVVVKPLGNTTDVSASNVDNWKDSATHVEALPTAGVAHTDMEQAMSKQYHRFTTGTEPRSIQQTGELNIPFVDISKMETIINDKTDLTFGSDFNFVDQAGNQTGIKTGLYGADAQNTTGELSDVNLASLLTENDSGYANLHHNLAAPFLVATKRPSRHDGVKPDLFANYTLADEGRLTDSASTGSNGDDSDNYFAITDSTLLSDNQAPVDMRSLGLDKHVIGNVTAVWDMPRQTLEQLRVNPIFQSRLTQGQSRNPLNEGHRRLGGSADTAGADQLTADFAFMLLGGSNYDYFSKILPQYEGIGQDLSNILEDLIMEGAIGRVEIAFNSVGR